jgi:hypothetical protein
MAHRPLLVGADESEELGPGGGVAAKLAVECGGDGGGPGCCDAAHGHAQMFGFHDDAHPARRYVLLEPVGDLLGEPFLDLGAAREQLDHPSQLGQAKDPLPREVADMGHSEERAAGDAHTPIARGWSGR